MEHMTTRGGTRKPKARKVARRAARGAGTPAAPAVATVAGAGYPELLQEIWQDVQPLIGSVTLSALVESARRRTAVEHKLLGKVRVSADGIDGDSLLKALSAATGEEGKKAMQDLTKNLIALFDSIAGPLLVKQILPKVIRLEKQLAGPAARTAS